MDTTPQGQTHREVVVKMTHETLKSAVIVNPMASGGGAAEIWPAMHEVLRQRLVNLEVVETRAPGHASVLCTQALEAGAEMIVAVGGDGTVNEVLQGFIDRDGRNRFPNATLGILHAGTGGDFQRMFGRVRASRQVERLINASTRPVDYGVARYIDNDGAAATRAFMNVASVGLSPEIVREVNTSAKNLGASAYILGALRGIARYRNQQVEISHDGGPATRLDLTLACVANGQYFGGGMWVCPQSKLSDGLFDLLVLSGMSRSQLVATLAKVFRGRHLRTRGVETSRVHEMTMSPVWADNHVLLEVDGEQVGRLPGKFTIAPQGLRLRL